MVQVRWKNNFPPDTKRGGYQVFKNGRWVNVDKKEVRRLIRKKLIHWN